eukprot:TRINITY_DN9027_c0_g1_i1.p2 TRINITY_DN9027_c0_g1~~TRINITY_DN9027_c0_g1_i1.p2  ORF type:complete len:209 (-),score=76.68 TRINITY_DN9027_c0_g1_i1:395-1021(-)
MSKPAGKPGPATLTEGEVTEITKFVKAAKASIPATSDDGQVWWRRDQCFMSIPQLTLALPPSFGKLTNLTTLTLNGSSLAALPDVFGGLWSLRELSISNFKNLTALPLTLWTCTTLRRLTLGGCTKLATLHAALGQLKMLVMLSCRGCTALARLPDEVRELALLEELNLVGCPVLSVYKDMVKNPGSNFKGWTYEQRKVVYDALLMGL